MGFYILDKLRKEVDLEHICYPYLLHPNAPEEGINVEQTFSEEQRKKSLERLESLGNDYNLEFNSGSHIYSSTRAHKAALYAKDNNKFYEFAKMVFDSVFKDGKNIGKKQVLDDIASSLDLNIKEMNKAIDDGVYDKYLERAKQASKDYDVKSVPTFIVNNVKKNISITKYESFKENLLR